MEICYADLMSYSRSLSSIHQFLEGWSARHPRPNAVAAHELAAARSRWGSEWLEEPVPTWAAESSKKLKLVLDSGLGSAMDAATRVNMLHSLRVHALKKNTASTVHDQLKSAGAPVFTEKQAYVLLSSVFINARVKSALVIYQEQPGALLQTISSVPGIGALMAAKAALTRPSRNSRQMVEILARWGADWDLPSVEGWVKSLLPDKRKEWDALRSHLDSHRFSATLPPATRVSSRPRI